PLPSLAACAAEEKRREEKRREEKRREEKRREKVFCGLDSFSAPYSV
ncbi:hypothetical protein LVI32_002176, partial [Neisseria gonorrhoeae]